VGISVKKGQLSLNLAIPQSWFRDLVAGSRQIVVSVTGILNDGRAYYGTDTIYIKQ